MIVMATCDGSIDQKEIDVLRKYAKSNKIKFVKNEIETFQLEQSKNQIIKTIQEIKSLNDIRTEEYYLWELLENLQNVSQADSIIQKSEQELISILHIELGVKTSFSKQLIWDDKQKEIINSTAEKRLVISAPPGAGKTELIANQVIKFTTKENLNAEHILLISFTNNAITEMRDRIAYRTDNKTYPYGLKFLTLDKLAFRANKNFNNGFEFSGESYSHSLSEFEKLIAEKDEQFIRYIRSFRHLFIDEAQDVADEPRELRKKISLQLIEIISDDCGVSIYGDEAQKIYPLTGDFNAKSLLQEIDDNREARNFKRMELNTIHRTNDETLIQLVDDMRLEIMLYDETDIDQENLKIDNPITKLNEEDFDKSLNQSTSNYLFLFISNKEIVQASHNIMTTGQSFRLNSAVGKFDEYYPLWLNELILFCEDQNLDEIDFNHFDKFHYSRDANIHMAMDTCEIMWKRLIEFLGKNESIPIRSFIELLAETEDFRKKPEFKNKFHGKSGPVLSTVHSAKGSQADHVILSSKIFKKEKFSKIKDANLVFVAFSRAKKSAILNPGLQTKLQTSKKATYFNQFRHYEPLRKVGTGKRSGISRIFKIEIGLKGDYDPASIVSKDFSLSQVDDAQRVLRYIYLNNLDYYCYAERQRNSFHYILKVRAGDDEVLLGYLKSKVHTDIANRIKWNKFRHSMPWEPPLIIEGLTILDVASRIASEDDLEKNIHTKYSNRRTWIYPIIYGTGPIICEPIS